MSRDELLFYSNDWFSVERNQVAVMSEEIEKIQADRLLNTPVNDLAEYFFQKFKIDVPELNVEETTVDQSEKNVPVRDYFSHENRHVKGLEISVEIPFTGDKLMFHVRPTSYDMNPPRAEARSDHIFFTISGTELTGDRIKSRIDETTKSIQTYLTTLKGNAAPLNARLKSVAESMIQGRRDQLLASRNMVGSMGFKMKERPGTAKTYAAPEVRRKITPVMPPAGSAPYKPEPQISQTDYDHIIEVMHGMTEVMERSPSAFSSLNEEALRTHFLVPLNGHYLGQATGETFNYEGKTDILISSNGKNIFIAELKFWGGPKKHSETIDQLLSYSSWRDTKTAIVIFNRNKNFSEVLKSLSEATKAHPNFKRQLASKKETEFRYVFSNRDDPGREMFVTVLAFDVPGK